MPNGHKIFEYAFGIGLLEVYGKTWVKLKLNIKILKINK